MIGYKNTTSGRSSIMKLIRIPENNKDDFKTFTMLCEGPKDALFCHQKTNAVEHN